MPSENGQFSTQIQNRSVFLTKSSYGIIPNFHIMKRIREKGYNKLKGQPSLLLDVTFAERNLATATGRQLIYTSKIFNAHSTSIHVTIKCVTERKSLLHHR
jgi:hypothetical protein